MPGRGRKFVRLVERGIVAGVRGAESALRTVVEVIDEAPKAFDRIGNEIESVLEKADEETDREVVDAKDAEEGTLRDEAPDREP